MGTAFQEQLNQEGRLFRFHADYWRLLKKYINGDNENNRTAAYWDELLNDVSELNKKYNFRYARELMITFIDEIKEREDEETPHNNNM